MNKRGIASLFILTCLCMSVLFLPFTGYDILSINSGGSPRSTLSSGFCTSEGNFFSQIIQQVPSSDNGNTNNGGGTGGSGGSGGGGGGGAFPTLAPAGTPSGNSGGNTSVAGIITANSSIITSSVTFSNVTSGVPVTQYTNSSQISLTSLTVVTNRTVRNAIVNVSVNPAIGSGLSIGTSPGNTYQSFEIITAGVDDSMIAKVVINFIVNTSWIDYNAINAKTINLYRSSDSGTFNWTALPTTFLGNDSQYYYFSALSPGFSRYAIFGTIEPCNDGEQRCALGDSQICSSNAWILSQHCQLGCNPQAGRCVTTSDEAANLFQGVFSNVLVFFSNIPASLQLTVGSVTYYVLIVMVISGAVAVSYSLYHRISAARSLRKKKKGTHGKKKKTKR
jgi:PGF-pre-PGF domain-containing protein